ncbi:serine/threonine-protein kinase [Nonomuraea jiangxiensis]|uniref:non-specific serine/threonine protein kinase n=1 Tax=Nonomuraea jiangxiensis TaxID=633440 RepID=A0A1G8HIZ8_9ACTN|nr:serine/threonine-protein kinase [Nonomuraea jiangxiensis]SDI06623.1 Serine/threonine protein kinase [Nonomuraea jiangxiensis]
MTSDRKQDGRRIAGRYQLQEPIGRGGMGIVWRAHDELLDRTVAVKEVRYAAALGEEVQLLNRRTMREARAAARFEHPNVIVVHDVIEEDDRPWIVMQLVPSRSLGAVIKQDGPLPAKRVAEIGLAVLDALHRAHESGVLHRDVKPENVLLADDGRVVLTDFGIATLETETQLTVTGLAGTPAFIAPERLKGLPARRESDLWSLGATLYTAVEGRSPHERGMALATMHAVLTDEPDPATHLGPLTEVINGLLVKEPVQRLTYEETQRLLRNALAESSPPPTAQIPVTQPSPGPKKSPLAKRLQMPAVASFKRAPVEDDTPTDPDLVPTPEFPQTGARLAATPSEPPSPPAESTVDVTKADNPRRTGLVISAALAVVLVAGVGGYLGLRSAPEDTPEPRDTQAQTVPQPSPSGSPPQSAPSTAPPTVSATPSATESPAESPSPTPSEEPEKDPLPSGWKMYKDKAGFSIGLPKGWKEWTRDGRQVKFKGPGAAPNAYLMIEEAAKPGTDPLKDWKKQEPNLKRNFGGYRKLDIKKVDDLPDGIKAAADWDFTWNTNTGPTRVRNRAVVMDNGRAYAIYWHTLKSHWKDDYDLFEGFYATFKGKK